MIGKRGGVVTSEMLNGTAANAFSVKVLAAIARLTHVLINVAISFCTMDTLNHLITAQLTQVSVDGALARLCISIDCDTQLLRGKLYVRILCKKLAQSSPTGRLIGLF